MANDLDTMIGNGQICPELQGLFSVLLASSGFQSLDDQVLSIISLRYQINGYSFYKLD